MENRYVEPNVQELKAYDAVTENYFATRSRSPRKDSWTKGIGGVLERERRPFIWSFCARRASPQNRRRGETSQKFALYLIPTFVGNDVFNVEVCPDPVVVVAFAVNRSFVCLPRRDGGD